MTAKFMQGYIMEDFDSESQSVLYKDGPRLSVVLRHPATEMVRLNFLAMDHWRGTLASVKQVLLGRVRYYLIYQGKPYIYIK